MPAHTVGWKRSRPCKPDGTVHLDAESAIDLELALVVLPGHAEDNMRSGSTIRIQDLAIPVFLCRCTACSIDSSTSVTAWRNSGRGRCVF